MRLDLNDSMDKYPVIVSRIIISNLRHVYQLDKILERYVSLYNDTVT